MTDGLMRRFNLVYTEKDHSRDFTDYPIYNEKKITDEMLSSKFEDLFFNIQPDVNYTFSNNAFELYRKYFKIFWHRKYKNILTDKENFYRTYMMQSWKFAVFYHLILNKKVQKFLRMLNIWNENFFVICQQYEKVFWF